MVFYHNQKMFYLLKGWKTIQKVIRSCVICKIRNCQMKNKTIAPIPELLPCRHPDISKQCFDVSFYDIAGPFYISDPQYRRMIHRSTDSNCPDVCKVVILEWEQLFCS